MLTVGVDAVEVERQLAAGELACPVCDDALRRWGFARERAVRGLADPIVVRPRRGYCRRCQATHVLLPMVLLLRRADVVDVIGSAVAARAAGLGVRPIAAGLGRAWETVRGWLRRFATRVETVRAWAVRLVCAVAVDPVVPEPAGSVWADALAALDAVIAAVAVRFPVTEVTGWQMVAAMCHGRLLAPGWPPASINTSSPWAAPG